MAEISHREKMAEVSRQKSQHAREIGPLPPVQNPKRRAKAEDDLEYFLRTYLPLKFFLAWSADHRKAIAKIESAIIGGGCFAFGMPRGDGKTSLCVGGSMWGTFTGRRRYMVNIGAESSAATGMLQQIKTEIENNDLLLADWPEICFPVRCLNGISQRAHGQLLDGKRTHITWAENKLILPTIEGAKSSGATIEVAGITGKIRGLVTTDAMGNTFRPDIALIDDPQTDESAHSESQCRSRSRIIEGAISGLAGPASAMTLLMPCTVIVEGDLADTFLTPDKKPAWKGERFKICYSLPTNQELWDKYAEIRKDEQKSSPNHETPKANSFYRKHRKAMDVGCTPAWKERKKPHELSAIQSLMNILIDKPEAFWAEYMNQPKKDDDAANTLTADDVASKVNGFARRIVPEYCTRLTAFIDVHAAALYYVVVAWEENSTGYVVDYGVWPEQKEKWYQLATIKRTIPKVLKISDLEGSLWQALGILVDDLNGEWKRSNGSSCSIDRIMIDANWHLSQETVYRFCKQSPHRRILTPSHGQYHRASSQRFKNMKAANGERVGSFWKLTAPTAKRIRHCSWHTNHWKSFVYSKLGIPYGQATSISLWGSDPTEHALFSSHMMAEYRTVIEVNGESADEWDQRPERPDNHWWDGLVGCAVGASVEGISPLGPPPKKKKRRRLRLSELQGARE